MAVNDMVVNSHQHSAKYDQERASARSKLYIAECSEFEVQLALRAPFPILRSPTLVLHDHSYFHLSSRSTKQTPQSCQPST